MAFLTIKRMFRIHCTFRTHLFSPFSTEEGVKDNFPLIKPHTHVQGHVAHVGIDLRTIIQEVDIESLDIRGHLSMDDEGLAGLERTQQTGRVRNRDCMVTRRSLDRR